ncbi:hypothetical protein ACSMX9_15135 [Streptomyces sp. LE64]|uniref:hypothetical protein n=1 Tax=Streptomyces sp. LE64 TaxID=3448653 RepID=UPI0040431B85
MSDNGVETSALSARSRALDVLRVRSRATAVALLPAAAAIVLFTARTSGHLDGGGALDALLWVLTALAVAILLAAAGIGFVVARSRPAVSPTVPVDERSAPDLYRMVRELADRLDVPAPSAIALTPDCDSWLEDRTHRAQQPRSERPAAPGGPDGGPRRARRREAPVLIIGSPFLWWMRVAELRAVLAPVVAGTGPSAHPDVAAARRFVRGLDAAVAVASRPGRGPLARLALGVTGSIARLLLRACRGYATEMERGVAAAAAARAQDVDYGLRIVAQEQVGLAYAGWDRLLTRVALPAWRVGRWPSRLDAGVVAALTELSRRDRLAEGFASRLAERPACDLLEEPGAVDEAASLLAARLFHGGPAEPGRDWAPVGWEAYPEEVVDRTWRTEAARLHRVLDGAGARQGPEGPTLARVLDHLALPEPSPTPPRTGIAGPVAAHRPATGTPPTATHPPATEAEAEAEADTDAPAAHRAGSAPRTEDAAEQHPTEHPADDLAGLPADEAVTEAREQEAAVAEAGAEAGAEEEQEQERDEEEEEEGTRPAGELAAALTAALAREEGPPRTGTAPADAGTDEVLWNEGTLPLFPLQPPRSGRDLLAEHVMATVCCAAVDTAGAAPALDWLDGPSLLVDGARAADLSHCVRTLVDRGDPAPLRRWLAARSVRTDKPLRLV